MPDFSVVYMQNGGSEHGCYGETRTADEVETVAAQVRDEFADTAQSCITVVHPNRVVEILPKSTIRSIRIAEISSPVTLPGTPNNAATILDRHRTR